MKTEKEEAESKFPDLTDVGKAYDVAKLACEERQPMPNEGVSDRLIAEMCELIGERAAGGGKWRTCADAHRMACWYWRKTVDA